MKIGLKIMNNLKLAKTFVWFHSIPISATISDCLVGTLIWWFKILPFDNSSEDG
jgi:hypothetical protein